jgi:hypothetical protein
MKVCIVEYATGKIIKEIDAGSERSAERVERGLNINLNHDKYYTILEGGEK